MERSSLPLLHGKAERLAERRTKVSKKVSNILPKTEILAQLAEEASELAQAALKLPVRWMARTRHRRVLRSAKKI